MRAGDGKPTTGLVQSGDSDMTEKVFQGD